MSLRVQLTVVASAALVASACGAGPGAAEFADPDVPASAANPDGTPYPTDHLGGAARAGGRPGDRIPNLAFQGYRESNRDAGLTTLSLADYYDPTQARHKLLHLQVAATWCAICSSESDATVKVKEPLGREGAVFLQVVVNGDVVSKGPSLDDVASWMDRHASNYSIGIDVRARRLAGLGVGAVPWNFLIDTRTMEILDATGGAPDDIVKYVRLGLRWVDEHPASY